MPSAALGRLGAPWPMSRLRIADHVAEVSVRPFGPSVTFALDGRTSVTSLFQLPRTRGVLLRRGEQWSVFSAGSYNDEVLAALRQAGATQAERPTYREFLGLAGRQVHRKRWQRVLPALPFVAIGAAEALTETPFPWPW